MTESIMTIIGETLLQSLNKTTKLKDQKIDQKDAQTKSKDPTNTQTKIDKQYTKKVKITSKKGNLIHCKDTKCPELNEKKKTVVDNQKKIDCLKSKSKKLMEEHKDMVEQIRCLREMLKGKDNERYKAEKLTKGVTTDCKCLAKKKAVHMQRLLKTDPLLATLEQKYACEKLTQELENINICAEVKLKGEQAMYAEIVPLSKDCERLTEQQKRLEIELSKKEEDLAKSKASLVMWFK